MIFKLRCFYKSVFKIFLTSVNFQKQEIESDILPPLNSLLLMYQGPHKVIRKRYDKLLDYDSAVARQRNAGDHDQAKAVLCIDISYYLSLHCIC